jgi:hypothetical protein
MALGQNGAHAQIALSLHPRSKQNLTSNMVKAVSSLYGVAQFNPRIPDMSNTFPDRLSVNPNSPFYNEELLQRDVGINFNGKEKTNVEEYCISEGWIKVSAGAAKDRFGNPMTLKLKGNVEPFFRDAPAG